MRTISSLGDLRGKLVRSDFNVPLRTASSLTMAASARHCYDP